MGFPGAGGPIAINHVAPTAASARLRDLPPKAVLAAAASEPLGAQARLARYKQVKSFVQIGFVEPAPPQCSQRGGQEQPLAIPPGGSAAPRMSKGARGFAAKQIWSPSRPRSFPVIPRWGT